MINIFKENKKLKEELQNMLERLHIYSIKFFY